MQVYLTEHLHLLRHSMTGKAQVHDETPTKNQWGEQLIVKLRKKSAIYWSHRLDAVFTTACNLSLSSAKYIVSIPFRGIPSDKKKKRAFASQHKNQKIALWYTDFDLNRGLKKKRQNKVAAVLDSPQLHTDQITFCMPKKKKKIEMRGFLLHFMELNHHGTFTGAKRTRYSHDSS